MRSGLGLTTRLGLAVVLVAIVGSVLAVVRVYSGGPASPVVPSPASSPAPVTAPGPALGPISPGPAGPTSPTTPTTPPTAPIALVPVVGFWSVDRMISSAQLAADLAGTSHRFRRILVAAPDLPLLAIVLDVRPGAGVVSATPAAILAAVEGTTDVIGIVRAEDVRPSVRALGVDGVSLFGDARRRSFSGWPLVIPGPASAASGGAPRFDPATTWTLVAAGDVMNDRSVYRQTILLKKGPDFPWDGGTARIVRRSCCSAGLNTVVAQRTGHPGAVRRLFQDADLALVNHEGPTPTGFTYHPAGLVFTFDPALEAGIHNAGVDVVSLANNHIRNAGSAGVLETIRNVSAAGLVPLGAGKNVNAARQPAWYTVDGVRVAILAFDAINLVNEGATASRPGAAPLLISNAVADIHAARASGAEVVIAVPHWGVEYTAQPSRLQRRQAAALIAAGADAVLGSHPHWAGALEAIGRGVVVYSMGDFIFDLPRSEQTDEGLIVELTFVGRHLAQIDIHPTIELDRSQPNLLDPAGGQVILDRIRQVSSGFLD